MTPELQQYYDSQWTLFASKGWQDLLEDLQILEESIENIRTVATIDDLNFRKGQLDILRLMLERKATCEKTFEGIQDE